MTVSHALRTLIRELFFILKKKKRGNNSGCGNREHFAEMHNIRASISHFLSSRANVSFIFLSKPINCPPCEPPLDTNSFNCPPTHTHAHATDKSSCSRCLYMHSYTYYFISICIALVVFNFLFDLVSRFHNHSYIIIENTRFQHSKRCKPLTLTK